MIKKPVKAAPPAKKTAAPPPKKTAPTTAVAVRATSNEIAPAGLLAMLAEDAGSGMENMRREDFAVPRLSVLQSLSPAVNKRSDEYVDGAEVGMILDNVSHELYSGEDGILVALVSYRRANLGFWPRDSTKGKGFVSDFGDDPAILRSAPRDEKYRHMHPSGYEIVPTAEYFAFLIDEETGQTSSVLISMSKSQMQKALRINSLASTVMLRMPDGRTSVAPLFYRTFRLKTKPESNDRGNWFGWDPEPGPYLTVEGLATIPENAEVLENGVEIYLAARSFRQAVQKGDVKVQAPMGDDGGHVPDNNEAPM